MKLKEDMFGYAFRLALELTQVAQTLVHFFGRAELDLSKIIICFYRIIGNYPLVMTGKSEVALKTP